MKPLNGAERNSAFVYFLILFVITTGLVVLAVFFGMRVPFQQNEKLEQQISVYQNEQAFADNFSAKMTDTKLLLDSIPRAGTRTEFVSGQIANNLVMLTSLVGSDTANGKKIYHDIISFLSDLQDAKTQLQEVGSKDAAAGQSAQTIQDLQTKLEKKTEEAMEYRNQLIANGINPVQSHN